jgi:hypothetical protein
MAEVPKMQEHFSARRATVLNSVTPPSILVQWVTPNTRAGGLCWSPQAE